MKNYFFLFIFISFFYLGGSAQVGVNTETPKATVDIQAGSTANNTTEGLIVPRLTRSQLMGKDNLYGTDQVGSLIYVTSIDGTLSSSGRPRVFAIPVITTSTVCFGIDWAANGLTQQPICLLLLMLLIFTIWAMPL